MKRWAFLVPFLFLGWTAAAGICGAAPAEDLERRIGELEKAVEESVKSGRGLSPELMEELAKAVEELLKGEKDPEESDRKETGGGWEEVPFTGTITVSRNLSGSAVMKEAGESGTALGAGKKGLAVVGEEGERGESVLGPGRQLFLVGEQFGIFVGHDHRIGADPRQGRKRDRVPARGVRDGTGDGTGEVSGEACFHNVPLLPFRKGGACLQS